MSAAESLPSCVVLPPDGVSADAPSTPPSRDAFESPMALLSAVQQLALQRLRPRAVVERGRPRPLGWHPRGGRLAVLAEKGFIVIHKVDANTLQLVDDVPERLANAGVKGIAAIAWRPMDKNFLAVAHAGGVSVWTTCGSAPAKIASGIRGLAPPSSWRCTALQSGSMKQSATALCWSPCGQFLAVGSPEDTAFEVWDIATRVCTRLRSGAGGARVLRWSPLGNYLLVAGFDGRDFQMWETHSWTCQNWSTGSHALTDAAWAANESAVLIALDGSGQLGVLQHMVGSAPSLLAHLLPIDLPVLSVRKCGDVRISSLAFDSAACKLAVACTAALGDSGAVEHLVYVYALQSSPVYLAKLLGTMQPPVDAALAVPQCKMQAVIRPGGPDRQLRSVLTVTWQDGSVALATV